MEKKISFIISAAGLGKRLGAGINKTLLEIEEKSILQINIENCIKHSQVFEIIISYHQNDFEKYKLIVDKIKSRLLGIQKTIKLVQGGKERHHSVFNALKNVNQSCDYVMIHDGARPFLPSEVFDSFLSEIKQGKEAIIPYLPAFDTSLYVNESIDNRDFYLNKSSLSKLNRDFILSIQTPQCFSKNLSDKIMDIMRNTEVKYTDESTALLESNENLQFIKGSRYLHKITNMDDYEMAKATYRLYLEKEEKYLHK